MLLRFSFISAAALLCLVAASTHAQVPSTVSASPNSLAAMHIASVGSNNSNTGAFPVYASTITEWDMGALGDDVCGCMDLVFIIDITQSMELALPQLKNATYGLPAIINLAEIRSDEDLRLGLVTFCDLKVDDAEEVTVNYPLTYDVDAVRNAIVNLPDDWFGENDPEPSDEALREVLRPFGCPGCGTSCLADATTFDQPFRSECIKHVVLITDAVPAGCDDEFQDSDETRANHWADEAADVGVMVSAMFAVDVAEAERAEPIMRYYAGATGGRYSVIGSFAEEIGVELSQLLATCSDCNSNGISDVTDISAGTSEDCNSNGTPDECESDCNSNGVADDCDIAAGTSTDCNDDGIPDECPYFVDCNANSVHDYCDILGSTSDDCDSNGIPDECTYSECPPIEVVVIIDTSGSMDAEVDAVCDDVNGLLAQVDALNSNGSPYIDVEIMTVGPASSRTGCVTDCDVGTIGLRSAIDCSCCTNDSIAEVYGTAAPSFAEDIYECGEAGSDPVQEDWGPATAIVAANKEWTAGSTRLIIPVSDEGPRCGDGVNSSDQSAIGHAVPYIHEKGIIVSPVITAAWNDPELNDLMDLANMLAEGGAIGGRALHTPESAVVDGLLDVLNTARFAACDCNANSQPDVCDIIQGSSSDCNENFIPDECETDEDCNTNGIQDICDIYHGTSEDCNANLVPDECDTIYVDDSATNGLNDGTSWPNAFVDLQDALDDACGTREIWVAQGTYRPTVATDVGDARTKTFDISSGPLLYGGFAGSETSRDQRKPHLYETILSGDLSNNDEGFNNNGENAYHVVFLHRESGDPNAVLDGFTICHGNADDTASETIENRGGGLYVKCDVNDVGYSEIRGCRFTLNSALMAGGAVYSEYNKSRISNCVFVNNFTTSLWGLAGYGSALASRYDITVTNSTFVDNHSDGYDVGAIGVTDGNPTLAVTNCVIWGNTDAEGSGYDAQIRSGDGSVVLNYCCIQDWTSGGSGNTASDPLLLDTVGPVYDLRLGSGSPCIDSGDNTAVPVDVETDIAGQSRFIDDPGVLDSGNGTAPIVDMGAYERDDCNNNGVSDAVDIAGSTSTDCNEDGMPDECQLTGNDCNENGVLDECDLIFDQEDALTADDGDTSDRMSMVAADGNVVITGAPTDVHNGISSGSAYIFRESDITPSLWVQEQKLVSSDASAGDYFGWSLGIDGNVAVVGAPSHDHNSISNSGAAYVFRYDELTETWSQEAKLTATNPQASDSFGRSVDIYGDVIVAGAMQTSGADGFVAVFRYSGSAWVSDGVLTASDGQASDAFGISVALDDDAIVVGATGDDDNGSSSGSAYIFRYDVSSGTWSEEDKVTPNDGVAYDDFGWAVDIDDNRILVGATGNHDTGASIGSAYVFEHDSANPGSWTEEAKLNITDGPDPSFYVRDFGYSVALVGDVAVCSAPYSRFSGSSSGAVFAFEYDQTSWSLVDQVEPVAGVAAGDFFGWKVALTEDRLFVGSADIASYWKGAIYPFLLHECVPE